MIDLYGILATLEDQADSQASDHQDAAQFLQGKKESAFSYASLFGPYDAQMMAAIHRGMARKLKRREMREALQKTCTHPREMHVFPRTNDGPNFPICDFCKATLMNEQAR